jgi:hypothetical protein
MPWQRFIPTHKRGQAIGTDVLKAMLRTWKALSAMQSRRQSWTALGISRCEATGSVRLSLGSDTTQTEIEFASLGVVAAWHHVGGFDEHTRPLPSGVNQ